MVGPVVPKRPSPLFVDDPVRLLGDKQSYHNYRASFNFYNPEVAHNRIAYRHYQ